MLAADTGVTLDVKLASGAPLSLLRVEASRIELEVMPMFNRWHVMLELACAVPRLAGGSALSVQHFPFHIRAW